MANFFFNGSITQQYYQTEITKTLFGVLAGPKLNLMEYHVCLHDLELKCIYNKRNRFFELEFETREGKVITESYYLMLLTPT